MKIKMLAAILLATSTAYASAEKTNDFELEIGEAVLNTHLSSASGLVAKDGVLYAVGDDSPWLFSVDSKFDIESQYLIKDYPLREDGRIVKAVKPDYEAMAMVEHELKDWFLVLGSGSKAEIREWAYMISEDRTVAIEKSLKPLYQQLYHASGFTGEQELNIEGLVIAKDKAFIFNRGNSGDNLIFMLDQAELVDYITSKIDIVSELKTFRVTLPSVAGFEAGLSGGEFWVEGNAIIYSASVEATGDAYNDGEILGSFIGTLDLALFEGSQLIDLRDSAKPLLKNGEAIITKVESVAIVKSDDEEVEGVLVSDNDNGTSEFFDFELEKE